jgi:hypothetical protein
VERRQPKIFNWVQSPRHLDKEGIKERRMEKKRHSLNGCCCKKLRRKKMLKEDQSRIRGARK